MIVPTQLTKLAVLLMPVQMTDMLLVCHGCNMRAGADLAG